MQCMSYVNVCGPFSLFSLILITCGVVASSRGANKSGLNRFSSVWSHTGSELHSLLCLIQFIAGASAGWLVGWGRAGFTSPCQNIGCCPPPLRQMNAFNSQPCTTLTSYPSKRYNWRPRSQLGCVYFSNNKTMTKNRFWKSRVFHAWLAYSTMAPFQAVKLSSPSSLCRMKVSSGLLSKLLLGWILNHIWKTNKQKRHILVSFERSSIRYNAPIYIVPTNQKTKKN